MKLTAFACRALTSLAFATVLAMSPGHAVAQTSIVMSNDNNALGIKGQTFELLKRELVERLGDKVNVQLHHSGALFDQNTQVQGLQVGSAHVIAPGQGVYAPHAPKVNALSLPFLFSSNEAILEATSDPEIRAAIFPELEDKNILPIAVWLNGPRDIAYRGAKPILLPEDMAGLRIRVQSTPLDLKTFETFGANPVGIAWTETPTALQQGIIDAVEPVPNALVGAGLHEIVSQVSRVSWQYNFYIVGVNKMWWESMPAEVREGFQEALDVATKWNWENTERGNEEAYDLARETGVTIHDISPEQHQKWVDIVQPLWKEFGEALVGEEIIARIREIEVKHQKTAD